MRRLLIRLNKFLSQAGIASRREADRMISEGRVKVNGRVVRTLGVQIDPQKDRVETDGKTVAVPREKFYIVLHKPPGYLVTLKDPFERPTIKEFLPPLPVRVFPVGRLDLNSEGFLLLTNDGELANRLIHPRYQIIKEYTVSVKGNPAPGELKKLEKGIYLDSKKTAPSKIKRLKSDAKRCILSVQVREGRKREIRRMFELIGHPVLSLRRIRFAGISLGALKKGKWRHLRPFEVTKLKKKTGLA